MARNMEVTLVLTGAYAGKTIRLNGRQFVNGKMHLSGTPDELYGEVSYLGRCYQAYPLGSSDLEHALERDRANGQCNNPGEDKTGTGTESSQGDLFTDWGGSEEVPTDDFEGDANSEGWEERVLPSGDGYTDSGLSSEHSDTTERYSDERLAKIVKNLDPNNDEHWTKAGLPAISAVEQAYGSGNVTRALINNSIPNWNREKSKEAATLAEINQ